MHHRMSAVCLLMDFPTFSEFSREIIQPRSEKIFLFDKALRHGMDDSFIYKQLPRKRSLDGATTESSGGHLIVAAAYYSLSDPERMKS